VYIVPPAEAPPPTEDQADPFQFSMEARSVFHPIVPTTGEDGRPDVAQVGKDMPDDPPTIAVILHSRY
jgi:hypothetical protein